MGDCRYKHRSFNGALGSIVAFSEDKRVGVEERVLQFLEDWHLLHLRYLLLFQIIHIYSMRNIAEDECHTVSVHEDP